MYDVFYSSSALPTKTNKSKDLHVRLQQTANAETSGIMGNPIVGLKSITSGDRFRRLRTKFKMLTQKIQRLDLNMSDRDF